MIRVAISLLLLAPGAEGLPLPIQQPPDLVFLAQYSNGGPFEVFSTNNDGTVVTNLSGPLIPGGTVQSFEWSPDRKHVAFRAIKDSPGVVDLYWVPAAGGIPKKCIGNTLPGGDVFQVEWSPDGRRLAFTADWNVDGKGDLFILDTWTGKVDPASSIPSTHDIDFFAWAPGAKQLLYSFSSPSTFSTVHVVECADIIQITNVSSGPFSLQDNVTAAYWSPNSKWLALVCLDLGL